MKLLIRFLTVSLLEKNIGSDFCLLELSIILNCCRSNIYIYTTDCSVFVLDAVNGLDTLKDVLDWVVYRVLSCLNRKSLVSHILKCYNLCLDFLLSKLLSGDMLILCMIWAVYTAVYAVI